MTKAEMRLAMNQLIRVGKLSGTMNLAAAHSTWDFYLDTALDMVTIELARVIPESFVVAETVSLVADTNTLTLTNSWLQVWDIQKNVSSDTPTPLKFLNVQDRWKREYVGQTEEEPTHWYWMGDTLYVVPTPSINKTNYLKVFLVVKEASTMPTAGPTYIPSIAHRLIPIKAAMLVGVANGAKNVAQLELVYRQLFNAVERVLPFRVQGEGRYLVGSRGSAESTREKTEYDNDWE